jgi:heptosyltransferase-3
VKKIAIVSALGLGDGLLSMVIAHNLQQHDYAVTVFNNHLVQLQSWFPRKNIKAYPELADINQTYADYDQIISTDGAPLAKVPHQLGDKYKIFYEKEFDRSKTVLQNFLDICRNHFQLSTVTTANGIDVVAGLQFRKFPRRVMLHTMSTSPQKNWSAEKFVGLAQRLQANNWQPVFIASPAEHAQWESILHNRFALPKFFSVGDLAAFVYESGYLIGNDSGVGHLAANLGIPTLSLFARQSVANLWRPGWGDGRVVTPTFQLPGARLRAEHWQKFLSVAKVFKQFNLLECQDDCSIKAKV